MTCILHSDKRTAFATQKENGSLSNPNAWVIPDGGSQEGILLPDPGGGKEPPRDDEVLNVSFKYQTIPVKFFF